MTATERPARRLLVIGVGNRDRGDDAVGPIVCDLLREERLPAVEVVVFEGAMVDLALHWHTDDDVVVVDAVAPNGHAGRTVGIDALATPLRSTSALSTHAIDVSAAIELAGALDRLPASLTVIGIEAATSEHGAPLSTPVLHAAGRAVAAIRRRATGQA